MRNICSLASYAASLLLTTGLFDFAYADAASGTFEVDLIFPHNDTYAPEPIIPVAFAVQNTKLVEYLRPSVSFSIIPYGNYSKSIAQGVYDLNNANLSGNDPAMIYGDALEALNKEGTWLLEWSLDVATCSDGGDDTKSLQKRRLSRRHKLVFTTQNGAKKTDLTAASTDDSCKDAQWAAFEVVGTKEQNSGDDNDDSDGDQPCAALATSTASPSANPCAATIEASVAANVSASLTQRACAVQTADWCPDEDSSATGVMASWTLTIASIILALT